MEQTRDNAHTDEIAARTAAAPETTQLTSDQISILQLQSAAGNRAVGAMLRGPERVPARSAWPEAVGPVQRMPPRAASRLAIQRFWGDEELNPTPEEPPIPSDYQPPTLQWPQNDAEGVRNEPCFAPESQAMITEGVMHADLASGALTKMPPDISEAVKEIREAQVQWNQTKGSGEPGEGTLQAANEKISGAEERIAIYVTPVKEMLSLTATGTQQAAADAREAATMKTEASDTGPGDEPCFEDGQQSLIREGAEAAEKAAFLLDERPPDYKKAVDAIKAAADKLAAIGGNAPGQTKLKGAVNMLNRVADALEAYLTPVVKVLADAAKDIQAAANQATEAGEMSIRGEFAPKPEEPK